MRRRILYISAALAVATVSSKLSAQIDNLRVVVSSSNAVGLTGAGTFVSLGAYGYDAQHDTAYVIGFGADQQLRKISNVSGVQSVATMATKGQIELFNRDGNPDRSTVTPAISGLVLNPLPVGTFAANSFAIMTDIVATKFAGGQSQPTDPAASKRIFRYNLGAVPAAGTPAPPYGDARDIFTSLVTLADMNAVKSAPTNTSSNTGRQGAFSLDGQSYYFIDSHSTSTVGATSMGGIYKTNVLTGSLTLLSNTVDINTEPGVLAAPDGSDRILFQGTTGKNPGGVNYVDHSSSGTSAVQTFIPASTLTSFLERPADDVDIRSITTDAAGNVYLYDTTSKVLMLYDTDHHLSKVTTQTERTKFRDQIGRTGTVNGNILRLQAHQLTHATAGPITEVMFAETTAQNYVSGAYVFKPGDFDRDGALTPSDIASFKTVLTTRGGTALTDAGKMKYDMNGNAIVDWKDVKVLQPFYDFGDGDVNLDGIVDFTDFQVLQNSFGSTTARWIEGDLTGNNIVDFADFQILQNSFGYASGVLGAGLTPAPFDAQVWNAFVASVPEPSIGALAAVAGAGLLRRRRRGA